MGTKYVVHVYFIESMFASLQTVCALENAVYIMKYVISTIMKLLNIITSLPTPVSYTHLDVYKRQVSE